MADGKYKIEFETGSVAFTDDAKLAVSIARNYAEQSIPVSVWEKDRSGWQQIYPV